MQSDSPIVAFLAALLLACVNLYAEAQTGNEESGAETLPSDVDFRWGLELPMRDGVKLGALERIEDILGVLEKEKRMPKS